MNRTHHSPFDSTSLSSSSSSPSLPSSSPSPPFPSSPEAPIDLTPEDESTFSRRMGEIQSTLSTLAPSSQVDFLLSTLHSSLRAQLHSQHQASHYQLLSAKHEQLATNLSAQFQRLQQRTARLINEITGMNEDLSGIAGMVSVDGHHQMNGKDEKQPNGHHHPSPTPPVVSPAPTVELSTFPDFSDFSTLLASTEAQLEVTRKERERHQPDPPTPFPSFPSISLSSPVSSRYYHHDRTLTRQGQEVVRVIYELFASSSSMGLSELQRLSERVGREGGGDEGEGEVWWVWQSHASEDEGGGVGMTVEDLQGVYEQEWDVDEDAKKLGVDVK